MLQGVKNSQPGGRRAWLRPEKRVRAASPEARLARRGRGRGGAARRCGWSPPPLRPEQAPPPPAGEELAGSWVAGGWLQAPGRTAAACVPRSLLAALCWRGSQPRSFGLAGERLEKVPTALGRPSREFSPRPQFLLHEPSAPGRAPFQQPPGAPANV